MESLHLAARLAPQRSVRAELLVEAVGRLIAKLREQFDRGLLDEGIFRVVAHTASGSIGVHNDSLHCQLDLV